MKREIRVPGKRDGLGGAAPLRTSAPDTHVLLGLKISMSANAGNIGKIIVHLVETFDVRTEGLGYSLNLAFSVIVVAA